MMTLLQEVGYGMRAFLRHSPECPQPDGWPTCVCAVGRAAQYVEQYAHLGEYIEGCSLCGSVFPEHRCHGAGSAHE